MRLDIEDWMEGAVMMRLIFAADLIHGQSRLTLGARRGREEIDPRRGSMESEDFH